MSFSVATLKKISAASGLYFGLFLVLHLISHWSLYFGMETANNNLVLFRKLYQNPVFELGLLLALLSHMASNTMIYIKRSRIDARAKKDGAHHQPAGTMELQAHRYTGYFLAMSIFGHIAATRLLPLILLDDPSQYDYTFITEATRVFGTFFGVYLAVLGIAGGWHLLFGVRSAIATLSDSSIHGKPFPMLLKPLALVSHVLVVNAILVVSGYYYSIDMETKAELHSKIYSMFQ